MGYENFQSPSSTVKKFMDRSVPIDLEGLAHELGISIVPSVGMDTDVAGRICRENNQYKIILNSLDSHRRQRFTLAHEIAHYVLHKNLLDNGVTEKGLFRSGIPQSGLPSSVERQANIYAAEMLLPEDVVRNVWGRDYSPEKTYDVLKNELAQRFDVSPTAAGVRLKELGIKDNYEKAHNLK